VVGKRGFVPYMSHREWKFNNHVGAGLPSKGLVTNFGKGPGNLSPMGDLESTKDRIHTTLPNYRCKEKVLLLFRNVTGVDGVEKGE